MRRILIILIIISLAFSLFYIALQKRFYKTFLEETLVGIIQCSKSPDKNYDFYLFYFPVIKEKRAAIKFFKSKGKDWTFEGEIIKWKRPMNLIGFRTIQRPISVYDSAGRRYYLETQPKKIAFKLGRLLPCVDTSFISAVKQAFAPKIKFGIYATNSGYLIRKIR